MDSPPANHTRQLLDREAQLHIGAQRLDDLDHGRGASLLITGEPGIGKSRLAEELAAMARERGARVAWASAWQGDGAPPLWPWVQMLRELTGSTAALDIPSPETATESHAARFAQLEAIRAEIVEATSRQPLCLVFDDLQWFDSASLRALTFVATTLRHVPCLLVGTYRTREMSHEDVAELSRVGTTLALRPLADAAVAQLLRAAVGADISPTATEAIVTRSGGNPLFVWEFGQLMAQSGRVDIAPAAVPDAIAGVIERRLARTSEATVGLLRVAAVVGEPFSSALVASIAESSVSDVTEALDGAVRAGLLGSAAPETYTFSHDLIRDVLLDGLDASRRADLNERAATSLEPLAVVDASMHAAIADHLTQAGTAHFVRAATHWEQAAHRALAMLAHEEAAACFERAAQCSKNDTPRYTELLAAQGDALLLAGDLDSARARFAEVAELARSADYPELLARAVLGMGTGATAWEVPIANDHHVALVTDALRRLPSGEDRLRSMLLARLSVAAAMPGGPELTRARAEEALNLAEGLGDPVLIGQALAALNDAIAGPEHTSRRRENAEAIVELAISAGDRALELLGYRFLVVADLEVGDITAVDRHIAAFSRIAEALRQPLLTWYVPLFRGMRALFAGDTDAAERWCTEVADAAAVTGSHNALMLSATQKLAIDAARCVPPQPDTLADVVDVDPLVWPSYAAGLAFVALQCGENERARHLLRAHSVDHFDRLGSDSEQLTTLLLFGRVASELHELDAAQAVYELMLPHRGLWAVDGIAAACWAPMELELGRLATSLGRGEFAVDHLRRAHAAATAAGAVLIADEAEALLEACVSTPVEQPQPEVGDATSASMNVFRRDGQFWTLTFRDETVRMKDSKGLADLARMLQRPGVEIHVRELAGDRANSAPGATGGDLGELLDARARADYRRRLAELDEELDDADARADIGRVESARAERDFLISELSAALGLGGRPRLAGDPNERARKAVTARIRMTIGRIGREHEALARHLSNSIRTGTYCVYSPESATNWVL